MDDFERMRRIIATCSLDAALEAVGERWSFLILRGTFNGLQHFEQFQSTLGIARNILANRLSRLTTHGILERVPCADDRRKVEYRLTDKGAALLPAVVALRQWGEQWGDGPPCGSRLVDTRDGAPIQEVCVTARDGRALKVGELTWAETDATARPHARP